MLYLQNNAVRGCISIFLLTNSNLISYCSVRKIKMRILTLEVEYPNTISLMVYYVQ